MLAGFTEPISLTGVEEGETYTVTVASVKDFQLYTVLPGKNVTLILILKYIELLCCGKAVYKSKSLTLANSVIAIIKPCGFLP
jgi:hypothetical protein